jgi:YD repeat-containing protein
VDWTLGQDSDLLGRPIKQIDPNQIPTQFEWDGAGRLTSISPKAPEVGTAITYDTDNLGSIVSAGPQSTHYRYNGFGELASIQRQNGGTKTFSYDTGGRKTFETVWGTAAGTRFEFDGRGRIKNTTDPNGIVTRYTYNGPSKTVTVGDKNTTFTTDLMGRLITVVDALNHPTQYRYDPADRSVRVQQWAGAEGSSSAQVRTWEFDNLGRLLAITQPESGRTEYSNFTVTGKPQTTVYGAGSTSTRTVNSTFGVLDRLMAVTSIDGSVNQSFSYEQGGMLALANNKLTSVTSNDVTRTMMFNGTGGLNGRLTDLIQSVDGNSWAQKYAYNSDGSLAQRTYPDGKVQKIDYFFDKGLPKLTSFSDANLAFFDYEPNSWGLSQIAYTNGAASFFSYDPDQARLKSMTHAIPGYSSQNWGYQYNDLNQLTTDGEDTYGYDELGRLTGALVKDLKGDFGLSQKFDYDAFGNRIFSQIATVTNWVTGNALPAGGLVLNNQLRAGLEGVTVNMAFNANALELLKNQLPGNTATGVPTGATYDEQGNLKRIFLTPTGVNPMAVTMTYDALGRVTSLGDDKNATSQTYTYDDQGLRIKIFDSATGKTTYHIYNEARQLVAVYELVME